MKKIIFSILGLMTFATVHAQQTVIVQKTPGLLEGIVDAAVAVVTAPVVFGAAVVSGVEEVFAPAVVGTTRITTIPQYPMPIVATPAPVVTEAAMELYSSASKTVFGVMAAFLNCDSSSW